MSRLLISLFLVASALFAPLSLGQTAPPVNARPEATFIGGAVSGAAVYVEIVSRKVIILAQCGGDPIHVFVNNDFSGNWNTNIFSSGARLSNARLVIYGSQLLSSSASNPSPCVAGLRGGVTFERIPNREEAIRKSGLNLDSVAEYKSFYIQAYGVEPSARVAQSESVVRPIDAKSNVDEERIRREVQIRLEEERKREAQAKVEEERIRREVQASLEEERKKRESQVRADEERRQRELLAKAEEERKQRELQARAEEERKQRESLVRAQEERRQREVLAKAEEDRRQNELQAKAEADRRLPVVNVSRTTRKALIIGNDSYSSVPRLRSARTDASAIEQAFLSAGYAVSAHYDVNEREMKRVIREFVRRVEGGDEVFFFFAGHGVQLGGANYLLPTDIRAEDATAVRDEGISLQRVMEDLAESKARLTLAVIDACRDNPFTSAGRMVAGRGLAATNVASGQMIVFSAGAGQQALDHLGPNDRSPNGLFTRVFLKHIRQKGVTIDRIMRQVRAEVMQVAKSIGHDQVPALYDQVVGDFYFVP